MVIKREIFDYIVRAIAYEFEATPDDVMGIRTAGSDDMQTAKNMVIFVLDQLNFLHEDILILFKDYGHSISRHVINRNLEAIQHKMRVDPRVKVVADNMILLSKIYNGKYIIKEFSQGYSSHS